MTFELPASSAPVLPLCSIENIDQQKDLPEIGVYFLDATKVTSRMSLKTRTSLFKIGIHRRTPLLIYRILKILS